MIEFIQCFYNNSFITIRVSAIKAIKEVGNGDCNIEMIDGCSYRVENSYREILNAMFHDKHKVGWLTNVPKVIKK